MAYTYNTITLKYLLDFLYRLHSLCHTHVLKVVQIVGFLIIASVIQVSGKQNVDFKDIEAYINLPENQIDIGHVNFLLGKRLNPFIDIESFENEIDTIAKKLKSRIGREKKAEKIIPIINYYLFNEYGLSAIKEPYPEDFLLDQLISSKKGRCMSLVALYSTLAYRLDFPISGVCVPEHIFARWIPDQKRRLFFRKKKYINIETTLKGIPLADDHYLKMVSGHENPFYLRPLSKKELIGAYLSPLGSALRGKGRYDEAIAACRLAISININDAEAWNNLGITYRQKGLYELAVTSYNKALKIQPNFAEVWQNLGSVQETNQERIKCYKKAVAIKPSLGEAWKNLVIAYFENGDYELAWTCANRCQKLGHRIPRKLLRQIQYKLRLEE